MPIGGHSQGVRSRAPAIQSSVTHSDAAAARTTTQMAAAARLLSQTATPIIKLSDAKAVNQVSPMSASQPLAPTASASSAALKCQR